MQQFIVKEKIEDALKALVGQPLIRIVRAANMLMFGFGNWIARTDEPDSEVSEFALHVQCTWRIIEATKILVAKCDMYYPAGNPDEEPDDWEWDAAGANRCDERTGELMARFADTPLIVEKAEADNIGSLRFVFQGDVMLEVFPDDSLEEEFWRFFKPNLDDAHLVLCGNSLETD